MKRNIKYQIENIKDRAGCNRQVGTFQQIRIDILCPLMRSQAGAWERENRGHSVKAFSERSGTRIQNGGALFYLFILMSSITFFQVL